MVQCCWAAVLVGYNYRTFWYRPGVSVCSSVFSKVTHSLLSCYHSSCALSVCLSLPLLPLICFFCLPFFFCSLSIIGCFLVSTLLSQAETFSHHYSLHATVCFSFCFCLSVSLTDNLVINTYKDRCSDPCSFLKIWTLWLNDEET